MVKLIAEPDVSHLGDIVIIQDQIVEAWKAGADFYKLQVYNVEKLGKDWQHRYEFYKRCQVDNDDILVANMTCAEHGMELICTVNDTSQANRIWNLGIKNVKLASGQVNKAMMDSIMPYDWERIFLSTGMSSDEALSMLHFDYKDKLRQKKEVIIMHCVSIYPHLDNEVNLRRMESIEAKFFPPKAENFKLGYSDHSGRNDILPSIVAASMGAEYIELHVHDTHEYSPVEAVSCDWEYLATISRLIKRVNLIHGDGSLVMQEREVDSQVKYEGRWNG